MAISLVCGLAAGLAFMFLRESLISGGKSEIWTTINELLFQDITAEGAERSFGIFYIIGQLFIKALQLVIIPMVFTSIALAIGNLVDPPATMVNAAGDYVVPFIVERFVNGKDWLQKKLSKDAEKKIEA